MPAPWLIATCDASCRPVRVIRDASRMKTNPDLVELLIVSAWREAAIDFYRRALGATLLACYEHGPERRVSHAELDRTQGRVVRRDRGGAAWNSDAPPSSRRLARRDATAGPLRRRRSGRLPCSTPGRPRCSRRARLFGERMARVPRSVRSSVDLTRTVAASRKRRSSGQLTSSSREPNHRSSLHPVRARKRGHHTKRCPSPRLQGLNSEPPDTPATRSRPRKSTWFSVPSVPAGSPAFAYPAIPRDGRRSTWHSTTGWRPCSVRTGQASDRVVDWYVQRAARCFDQIWKVAERDP